MTKTKAELAHAMNATAARIEEAKRALGNICHHCNCPEMGTNTAPGEPESCWQGEADQPACLRIYQWRRIRFLERRHKNLLKRLRTA